MIIYNLTFGGKKPRRTKDANGNVVKSDPFTAKSVSIDFDALPETSRNKIIEYGLTQYISDGAAGAGDQTDFDSGIDDRVAKLKSGDFTRESRGPIGGNMYDSVEKLTAFKVRAMITAKLKAANLEVPKEKRAEMVAAFLADATKTAPFAAEAEKEIAAHKALLATIKPSDTPVDLTASAADTLAALGL